MRIILSSKHRVRGLLAGLVLVAWAHSSFAASSWDTDTAACGTVTAFSAGNILNCGTGALTTPDAPAVTPSAVVRLKVDAFSTTSGAAFAAASVHSSAAGLGVLANGADNPAVDNDGFTDAIRLTFTNDLGTQDANFNLTSITVAGGDGFTLLYWPGPPTGVQAPVAGNSPADLYISAGWTLVGNYASSGASTTVNLKTDALELMSVGSTDLYSSHWLVSAFNTSFGSPTSDSGNFTITAMAGALTPNGGQFKAQVPEPGSLALIGVALMGVVAVRRRKSTRA